MLKLARTPPLVDFIRLAWQRFNEERCLQSASSLTYTALLAIVPIITVALTLMSAFPVFRDMMAHIHQFLIENMLPESAETFVAYTERFVENAARLTAIGLIFLFVTAMIVLNTIESAFNQIWRVRRPRSPVQRAFVYWALLTVGPVLIGASLSLTSWFVSQSVGFVGDVPMAGEALLRVVPMVLTGLAFSLLYFAMPNRRVLLRDALSGGFIAALAFEAMKHGFALYIAHFPAARVIYGAFASVPIFLLWIYLSWLVVLSGAVIAAVMPEWRDRAAQLEPVPGAQFFDALQILHILRDAHHSGETVSLYRLQAAMRRPPDRIEAILEALAAARWVGNTREGWTLTKDASAITVADVYHLFVFRTALKLPARPREEVDRLALELAAGVEQHLNVTLEEFFARAAATPGAAPAGRRHAA